MASIRPVDHKDGSCVWRLRYRDGSGRGARILTETFSTERAAQEFAARLGDAKDWGAHAPVMPSKITVEQNLVDWMTDRCAEWEDSTERWHLSNARSWIVPRVGAVRLRDFGSAEVRAFRAGGYSPCRLRRNGRERGHPHAVCLTWLRGRRAPTARQPVCASGPALRAAGAPSGLCARRGGADRPRCQGALPLSADCEWRPSGEDRA